MKRTRFLPRADGRPYAILRMLIDAPGTFYQLCERAGIDLDQPSVECNMRQVFDNLLLAHIQLVGIVYTLNATTRQAMLAVETTQSIRPAHVPTTCSVAAPHYRGPSATQPVTIVRRAAQAGSA